MSCPRDLPGTQAIRILDVVAIGPAMLAAGVGWKDAPTPLRWFLGISGVSTVVFNGVNFVRCMRRSLPLRPLPRLRRTERVG